MDALPIDISVTVKRRVDSVPFSAFLHQRQESRDLDESLSSLSRLE